MFDVGSWRNLEINSVLLLRLLVLSVLIMYSFSVRQKLHRLDVGAFWRDDETSLFCCFFCPWVSRCVLLVRCGWRIFCYGMIVYVAYIVVWMFLQLVRCSSFLCRLCLWSRWLCRLHWWWGLSSGHWSIFLQLHPFCGVVLLLIRIFLLWLLMMLPMFGMQL